MLSNLIVMLADTSDDPLTVKRGRSLQSVFALSSLFLSVERG